MDTQSILIEYKKQERAGIVKIEKGELTQDELNKNLNDGVCLELMRLWLGFGIGNAKTKLKDSGMAKTQSRKIDHIKAMLNKVEEYWIDLCPELNDAYGSYFKVFLSGYHKKLHDIWVA